DAKLPNDQHPPHHVGMGEDLIAEVYNAVRNSPLWERTLMIVIYDEHGGIYDHAPPQEAVPPDETRSQPFGFDRYGVRVPAVLISPYIRQGTILKRPQGSAYPFDHTSVIATLRKCFDLGAPLTRRDAVAPNLDSVLNLEEPQNPGPERIVPLPYSLPEDALEKALAAPLNGFQKAMHEAAAHLPDLSAIKKGESVFSTIENHVENFVNGIMKEVPDNRTPAEAVPFMRTQLKAFLGR
ncbi:MAG TPA: alkaline phosphatase family protein, partial [Burkholderiales bacterium]|nr:alkaline phosphatase family protein [Burkholderiales bacterium]